MFDELEIVETKDVVQESHFKIDLGGSSLKHYKRVECDSYDIRVHGSSTLLIDELICKGDGKVRVASASTLIISSLAQSNGDCALEISGSSTMKIKGGTLKKAKGLVRGCSTGICHATMLEPSDVKVQSWSTWKEN